MRQSKGETMDDEWVALITEALAMGITEEEIREFLNNYGEGDELK